ncbi:MAG: hypothetical protein E7366_04470 [Clostridiales bacterium]|nr:hypothetical protein [Clostridiales bacterium]
MISVYNDADFLSVYKQRKRVLDIFLIATLVYMAFSIAWLIYYIGLPYKDPMQTLPKACVFVASAVYAVLVFPFMAIKFSRINRYYKLLRGFSDGLKNEEKNYFYCFEEKSLQKDNVDVIGCVFETWSKKKSEWMEREAYFDVEKPLPALESGDYVRYIVQSNFILQYEILEHKALEFEEVIDEEIEESTKTQEEAQQEDGEENE